MVYDGGMNTNTDGKSRLEGLQTYASLLSELSALYDSVVGLGVRAREQALVKVFWEMGNRIVTVLQMEDGVRTAQYGANVVERLGKDLTEKYGKGFGRTNMFYMRRFALEMKRSDIAPALSWTHYKALLEVDDRAAREKLMQQAADEQLKSGRLRRLVNWMKGDESTVYAFPLTPREGALNVVKVERNPFGDSPKWLVNLGFHVRCVIPLKGVTKVVDGELLRLGSGRRMARVEFARAAIRYCYEAQVVRVVDGDTLVLRIRLANGTSVEERIRLRGVDAAELDMPEGKQAKRFVERRVRRGDWVRVHTYGGDMYGRYVCDLFYGKQQNWLNRELVEKRAAKFMDMKV